MLNLVLFGPPGAGKGTQSQKLIDTYGLTHLSTGDILRSEIARGTALGMEAKQIMDKGDLVSDDIVIGMIESKIDSNPHAKGFIFDGFPRTQAQAVALDDLLQKKGTAISAMLALEVDNEELVKRLLLRGKDSGRADDQNESIIRNRVNEYNNKTLPLKKYYSEQAKFHSINGIGSVDVIFNDLQERITFIDAEIELTSLENDIEHLDLTINDFEVATEISEELKKDIEEVRKAEKVGGAKGTKKIEKTKNTLEIKKVVKKEAAKKAVAKKSVKKEISKHSVIKKKIASKSKPITSRNSVVKKTEKKVAAKKAVVKKIIKKIILTPSVIKKKVVSKTKPIAKKSITKVKPLAKKSIKKLVVKKPIKKVATKSLANKTKTSAKSASTKNTIPNKKPIQTKGKKVTALKKKKK